MSDANPARSVVFASVAGSARLREKLDHAEASRAVDRCLRRMERTVEVCGGRLVKTVGDQLVALFELPDQAFQAALQMQERVAELPPVSGVQLAIRIGFAHGEVGEDQGRMVGAAVDAAAHLVALAKPGQVLTGRPTQLLLSSPLAQSTREVGPAASGALAARLTVVELLAPARKRCATLSLRYGDARVVIDQRKAVITLGRDAQNDVEIRDRRASRCHARIERRGEQIVLVDSSSNGTYLTLDGMPELFLRGAECVIYGKGLISFASSARSPDADCATFE